MPITSQTLNTLEFPKVLAQLARHTSFSASRELALAIEPSTDSYEVQRRLRRTGEARRLLDELPDTSIGGARDIRAAVGLAQRGGTLDAPVFLEIGATLASTRRLRSSLLRLDAEAFVLLRELADGLPALPAIEDRIARTVGDDGGVLDSASPALGRLRAEIRVAFARLQDKLQSMISSSISDSLQEAIITVREGRYVLPVKAAARRNVRGLVHDQSASGATLYIEPLVVVELNNRWRELQIAEQREIDRILGELSGVVGAESAAITTGVDALADLDLALAMARYALLLRCVEPQIVSHTAAEGPLLAFREARHPLLDQQKVVPTTMRLGGEFRLLLITGPNTGGKTVALKTTGLLVLMAQAGMHIPASEPSQLPIFGQVFADIGDEQSIEQSLSTFSSHMTNIIRILRTLDGAYFADDEPSRLRAVAPGDWRPLDPLHADDQPALVLLDELGAGTDPVEGAALARAIVERLLDRGALGVATTHYAELKAFAYATDGVANGSVEFNVETLAPTYRLSIGLPGRSNALAIAQRLGLDPELVDRARSTMAREDAQVEDLLAGIYTERTAAADELQAAAQARHEADQLRNDLARERQAFHEARDAEYQAAQAQLDAEFGEVRAQLRRLRDDFQSVSINRQWLEEAEKRMGEVRERTPQRTAAPAAAIPAQPQQPRQLRAGDKVHVRSVGLMGEIIAVDDDEGMADVQVGGFRVRADLRELRREKDGPAAPAAERRASSDRPSLPPPSDVSMSIDMRGWRAGEVADKLDRYLNDAFLAGLPAVRIIHGKGTGALRQVVRDVLGKHKLVTSFDAGGKDGGEGVTVAKLAT